MEILHILIILLWNCFSTHSLEITASEPSININITGAINSDYSKVYFYEEINLSANTYKLINLQLETNDMNFGYIILQVHSYAYNVTFSQNKTVEKFNHQNGTNLGYVLMKSGIFYIYNFNHHINCNLAIIAIIYNSTTPLPGGCNLENNLTQSAILQLTTSKEMIIIDTPSAGQSIIKDPEQKLCNNITKNDLNYQPLYSYLPKNDFTKKTYFNGIKNLLDINNSLKNGFKTFKTNPPGPANRRTYIAIPGTGMVFNTIVKNTNGQKAAYIPIVTYSCQVWMWENGCNIIPDSSLMKILSYMLIIVGSVKIFVFFAEPFASLFLNCIPLGSYIVYRFIVNYDITPEIRSTILVISGLVFAALILIISIYCCGCMAFIFSSISSCIFSWIIAINVIYLFESNVWTTNDVLYQVIFWFSIFVILISTVKYFQYIWYIVNIIIGAYSMLVGLQIVTKSNLLIILIYHFNRTSIENYGSIDGLPGPDRTDIWLITSIIGIFFLGIIFKKNKLIVYGRKHQHQGEQRGEYESILDDSQPIITRWTHGSDDVFESPNTNHNFFRRMAQSPLWA